MTTSSTKQRPNSTNWLLETNAKDDSPGMYLVCNHKVPLERSYENIEPVLHWASYRVTPRVALHGRPAQPPHYNVYETHCTILVVIEKKVGGTLRCLDKVSKNKVKLQVLSMQNSLIKAINLNKSSQMWDVWLSISLSSRPTATSQIPIFTQTSE